MSATESVLNDLNVAKLTLCNPQTLTPELCIRIGQAITSAITLLKAQETTFEKDGHHIMCKSCGVYFCDMDREGDRYPQNFCPNCGKAVK